MTAPIGEKPEGNDVRHDGPDSRRHADIDSEDNGAPRRKYEIREGNSLSPRYQPSPRRDHRAEENAERRTARYDEERDVPRERDNPDPYERYDRGSHGEGRLNDVPRDQRRNDYESNGDRRTSADPDHNSARHDGDLRQSHENHDGRAPSHGDDRREGPLHQEPRDDHPSTGHPPSGDKMDNAGKPQDDGLSDGSTPGLINLFVRNVARHVIEQQLVDLFGKFGRVESAVVVRDPHSRECRGFGFVKMFSETEANQAMEALRDYEFEGRRISVERAKRNAPHSRTPGAYLGVDRRIRDRYAGMKRAREYEMTMHGYGGEMYGMRRPAYRPRYEDPMMRPRYDDRGWDHRPDMRPPYEMRPPYDGRERMRRRYEAEPPRFPREMERDNRFRDREPPIPRESADDYI